MLLVTQDWLLNFPGLMQTENVVLLFRKQGRGPAKCNKKYDFFLSSMISPCQDIFKDLLLSIVSMGSCQVLLPPASRPKLSSPEDRQAMAVLSNSLKPWISAYCTIRLHLLDCRALIPKHVVLPGWEPERLSWSFVQILWPYGCSLKIIRAM